jgi:hypothetical protein
MKLISLLHRFLVKHGPLLLMLCIRNVSLYSSFLGSCAHGHISNPARALVQMLLAAVSKPKLQKVITNTGLY